METLGNYLREERQKQGKTLKHIVQQTRISRTTLQAIEDDQYEQLPPASYLRGFLKLAVWQATPSPKIKYASAGSVSSLPALCLLEMSSR